MPDSGIQNSVMKKLSPFCLLVLVLISGCARNYVITLNNGRQLGAQGKPVLKGGSYYFKDASGQDASVAAGRVQQIETASSAARDTKPGYIGSPSK
jgi:hypothetical protein